MSLIPRVKVEYLVRCACGVLAMDRASLPEPCQEHGELAVVEYVRASAYQEVRDAAADLLRVLDRFDNAPVSATDAIDRLRVVLGGETDG